jgi:GrpB-like predicted nucleotidyltransferase (UPF0157 family)
MIEEIKSKKAVRTIKELSDMTLEELWQLFPIVLDEHDPKYAEWYEEEKRKLLELFREFDVQRITHIGSTSVESLIAKPIVDILLEFPVDYPLERIADLLKADGWTVMAKDADNQTLDLNKGYTPAGFAEKVYHLHVKTVGDWDELYFRDYLQIHPEIAEQYGVLKQSLKERFEHDRDAYTEAKTTFVQKYSQKARDEFGPRYLAE